MREIKFRAWDKKNRIMVSVDELHFPQGGIMVFDGCCSRGWEGKDFELMQFTGLRDSKRTAEYPEGQEIYEGDIVKWFDEEECCPVYYEMATCQFITKERWLWTNKENIEVIGNVYNNPDLLKGGQPDAE